MVSPPIWKICSSKWSVSPGIWMKWKKWNHHLEEIFWKIPWEDFFVPGMAEFLEKIIILPCKELKKNMFGWLWKMLSTWNQQNSRKKTRKKNNTYIYIYFLRKTICFVFFASDQWLVQNSPEWKSMWWPPSVCLPLICEKTTERFFPASFYAPGFPWSVPWPNWWTPQSANTQAKSSVFWRKPVKLRRYLVLFDEQLQVLKHCFWGRKRIISSSKKNIYIYIYNTFKIQNPNLCKAILGPDDTIHQPFPTEIAVIQGDVINRLHLLTAAMTYTVLF